jgi:hypothetical protein
MVSGSRTNTSKELVIYEPMTWDLVSKGDKVNRPFTTVTTSYAWVIQLFSCPINLKKMYKSEQMLEVMMKTPGRSISLI